jgi:fucose permease
MQSSVRFLKIILHFGFFLSGIATMLIGQVLPILSNRFALNDLQVSYCFPAQFLGSITGTLLTNWLGKQNKFLVAGAAGCFLMGLGILMLNLNRFELCLLGFFVNGVGVGLTLPSINMLTFELNPLRATSAVNVLNFFWGLGAIFCSLTILNFSGTIGFLPMSVVISVALFMTAGMFLVVPRELEQKPMVSENDDSSPPIWTNPVAWMIAGFNFIHVGIETGIGGWLPTYTQRVAGNDYVWWLAPTFLYFLFFVIGRGFAPFLLRFFNENQMLFYSLLVILGGLILMLLAKDVTLLGIGASIAGFGTSSVFPNNMSRFNNTFGASATRRGTPFFLAGTLGAASTTLLIGFMSTRYNNLYSGMAMLLVSVLLVIGLQIVLQIKTKKSG